MKEGWVNLHLLLWKHLIRGLVRVETEDRALRTHEIWRGAWGDFERKALAKSEKLSIALRRAESRGKDPPDLSNRGAPIAPLGTYNEAGEVVWDSTLVARIKELGAEPPKK